MGRVAWHRSVLTLNTDGRPHPVQNMLTGFTFMLGTVAFLSSFWHNLHLLSSWTGLFGILSGVTGQLISATTAERFILVIFLGMSALGFGIGLAHGGLFGGL